MPFFAHFGVFLDHQETRKQCSNDSAATGTCQDTPIPQDLSVGSVREALTQLHMCTFGAEFTIFKKNQ